MPVEPTELLASLSQLAANDPITASVAGTAIYDAVRRAAAALWRAPEEANLFDLLWCRAVYDVGDEWSPLLRDRVAGVRGAFAEGRACDTDEFGALLVQVGVHPDATPRVLASLEAELRQTLLEAARTDPRAFQPAVVDLLVKQGWLLEHEIRETLFVMAQDVADIKAQLREIIDGLAHRPQEMLPQAAAPPRELTDQEKALLERVQERLRQAPELIDRGDLAKAQGELLDCRSDLVLLLERAREEGVPEEGRRPLRSLLARADIQLGTAAFEAHQYGVAAAVYQRAADHAREARDRDSLALAVYQTGVAYAYGRLWRLAEGWFQKAVALTPGSYSALGNLAVVQSELGHWREALAAYGKLLPIYRELAAAEPAAFRPDVAMTLNNLGTVLSALGERSGAREAYEEALAIYAPLAEEWPKAFAPYLHIVLANLLRLGDE